MVDHGAADGMYISTSGVGPGPGRPRAVGRHGWREGDVVLCSGTIGDHGTAVMLARGDLALEADIVSDTAPLHELMERLLAAAPSTRWLRDATRGGVGTVCNELARDCNLTVVLDEAGPARPARGGGGMRAARASTRCTWPTRASSSPWWRPRRPTRPWPPCAATPRRARLPVSARSALSRPASSCCVTAFGGTRIVDMLVGDPLPRIC